MKRSLNFEFMRTQASALAEAGAAVEMHSHDSDPSTALAEARRFAEGLLKYFRKATRQEGHRSLANKTFEQLLQDTKGDIPDDQWKRLDGLRYEMNKVVHNLGHRPTTSVSEYLTDMWELGKWVWEILEYEGPAQPFQDPPRGGIELAAMRHQRDEAMRVAARPPVDVQHWIRPPSLGVGEAFVRRDSLLREVVSLVEARTTQLILLEGQPGRGKTTLMIDLLQREIPDEVQAIAFFFVDGHSKGEPRAWIRHLYASVLRLGEFTERDQRIEQSDEESLIQRLRARLAELDQTKPDDRILFVLDALDEAGPCWDSVWSFIKRDLPANSQIVATVRPGHPANGERTGVTIIDLEQPDRVNAHRSDGRSYVRAIADDLSDRDINEVAQFGDGNFLVLREICSHLPSVRADIPAYIRSFAVLQGANLELHHELHRRTWQRLERLGTDEFDAVRRVLALLAVSRDRLSQAMIKSALNLRHAQWKTVLSAVAEYLHRSEVLPPFIDDGADEADPVAEDATPVTVYRLFHETFRTFVATELADELVESEVILARECRNWLNQTKSTYERAYAVRFVVQHHESATLWEELSELLTDLKFVQARFEAGLGHDLLADYDRILPDHPRADGRFLQRVERDRELRQWVDALVEYAKECTSIRRSVAETGITDATTAFKSVSFPIPPDSELTIENMLIAESGRDNGKSEDALDPSDFGRLLAFRAFVASEMGALLDAPIATIDIARNYASDGAVAEAARRCDMAGSTHVRLLCTEPPPRRNAHPLVLYPFGDALSGNKVGTAAWMTPDARFAYVQDNEEYYGSIVDLRTTEDLWHVLSADGRVGAPIAMSIDGRWVVMQCFDPQRVELIDMDARRSVGSTTRMWSQKFRTTCDITPDGKRVVGVGDGVLVVWDTDEDRITEIDFGDFSPTFLLLCMSGAVASLTDEERGEFLIFDLISLSLLPEFDEKQIETSQPGSQSRQRSLGDFVRGQWYWDDYWVTCMQRFADCTADGELELIPHRNLVDIAKVPSELLVTDSRVISTTWPIWVVDATDILISVDVPEGTTLDDVNGFRTAFGDEGGKLRPPIWGDPCVTALLIEKHSRRVIRRFDEYASYRGQLHCISADGRYGVAREDTFLFLDLEHGTSDRERQRNLTRDEFRDDSDEAETELDDEGIPNDQIQDLVERDVSVSLELDDQDGRDNVVLVLTNRSSQPRRIELGSGFVPLLITPDLSLLVVGQKHDRIAYDDTFEWEMEKRDAGDSPETEHETNVSTINLATGVKTEIDRGLALAGVLRDGTSAVLLPSESRDTRELLFWSLDGQCLHPKKIDLLDTAYHWATGGVGGRPFNSPIVQSPDGRRLILRQMPESKSLLGFEGGPLLDLRLNADEGDLLECQWDRCQSSTVCFSPDGRFIVALYSFSGICLFSMISHECVGIYPIKPARFFDAGWIDCDGIIRTEDGSDSGLHVDDPQPGPAWITGARMFCPLPQTQQQAAALAAQPQGLFDDQITFRCKRCGGRFPMPEKVIRAIKAIHRNSRLSARASAVLDLPDEAWDQEKRLNFACPKCRQKLRSTPFFVDRRSS